MASDRNYSHPVRTSPIMMTSGVHPNHFVTETAKTEARISALQTKLDFCLPEQGPAVLPLHGKGGSPIKLAVQRSETTDPLSSYRGNLYKETLNLKFHTTSPTTRPTNHLSQKQVTDRNKVHKFVNSYTDAPIVSETIRPKPHKNEPISHSTSKMSNWRNILALDTPHEKMQQINN